MNSKNKLEKYKNIFLVSAVVILIIITLIFYFKISVEKERMSMKKDLEEIIWQSGLTPESNLLENNEQTHPETFYKLTELGVQRYFLSEVKLIDNKYTSVIHTCLYEKGIPIYPLYIYETWSSAYYPEMRPEISLVKYTLLPEDNSNFQPNKTCYIKEIKTEKDWMDLEKYNFRKDLFIN